MPSICAEFLKLQHAFEEATEESTAAINAQMVAAIEGRFDVKETQPRVKAATAKRKAAMLALIAHRTEHGCDKFQARSR
jgi:hypothetical protein